MVELSLEEAAVKKLQREDTGIHTVVARLLEMDHHRTITSDWVMEEVDCERSSANWILRELESRGVLYHCDEINGLTKHYTLDLFPHGPRTPHDYKVLRNVMKIKRVTDKE